LPDLRPTPRLAARVANVTGYYGVIVRGDDMAESYAELRQMSTDDVIRLHDHQAPYTMASLELYRNELTRREIEAHSQRMLDMTADIRRWTKVMLWLTGVITVMTAVNLAVFLTRIA
jgi:hypothetical protein